MSLLQVSGIDKSFGTVRVLKGVNLTLKPQTIHAIVGENGAGKSTLMKILYGAHQYDAGEIQLRGRSIRFNNPLEAVEAGIGMVFQHFMLIESFSALENLILGYEPTRSAGWIEVARAEEGLSRLLQDLQTHLRAHEPVAALSVIERQRLEILKVLYRKAEILIFDEPTAVLGPQEVAQFLVLLRRLRAEGRTILLISHKLREVLEIADEITVLRRGESLASLNAAETSLEDLVHHMIGRDLPHFEKRLPRSDPVRALRMKLKDPDLEIFGGEILGIAGLENQGQRALAEAISGVRRASVRFFEGPREYELSSEGIFARRKRGILHLSEDRMQEGLFLDLSLWENFYLGRRARERSFWLSARETRKKMVNGLETFEVNCRGTQDLVRNLSGGNQQKFWLSREVSLDPKVLVVEQPTRGIDLGAIEKVHERLMALRADGVALVVVSAELDELLALSDRILVMRGGEFVKEISALSSSWAILKQEIGEAMLCPGS